jgi:geranylgeranyl reductase family protein
MRGPHFCAATKNSSENNRGSIMKNMDSLRIAIVGAGPAGSAAARLLAARGAKVILLERKRFPRDKVCGDGCTPRCVQTLSHLGIDISTLPEAEKAPIDGFRLLSPSGHVYADTFPAELYGERAYTIPRYVLDEHLVRSAVQAGAELREDSYVEGVDFDADGVNIRIRGRDTLRADLVLGCDGAPSIVRKSLGASSFPDNHAAVAVRAYFEGVETAHPTRYTLFFDRSVTPAYAWSFPLPNGRANIGVGIACDQLAKMKTTPKKIFEEVLRSKHLGNELKNARRTSPVLGHYLPFGSYARELAFDRALLLGDAAGFINPISGEGIEFAMDSAIQAAATIEEASAKGDFSRAGLAGYAPRCESSFRKPFDANRRLMWLMQFPAVLDRMIAYTNRSPSLQRLFINSFSGKEPEFLPVLKELASLRPLFAR